MKSGINEYSMKAIKEKYNHAITGIIAVAVICSLLLSACGGGTISSVKHYTDFSSVPDFGAVTGVELVNTEYIEGHKVYEYMTSDISAEDIRKYKDVLSNEGFEVYESGEDDNGYAVAVFYNTEKNVAVALKMFDTFLIVGVQKL